MSKLLPTDNISFLNEEYNQDLVTVDCYCKKRRIYVIRHLLSLEECENIISWMNSETKHEELGQDSR